MSPCNTCEKLTPNEARRDPDLAVAVGTCDCVCAFCGQHYRTHPEGDRTACKAAMRLADHPRLCVTQAEYDDLKKTP